MCGDAHLAEDLVQETLAKVYLSWGKRSISNPPAYARTTLVRTFVSNRRRRMTSEKPTAEFPDEPGVLNSADASAVRLDLVAALNKLQPTDRAVLVARYFEDLSIDTIAEAMKKNPSAVRRQASRALNKLRIALGDHPLVEGDAPC